MLSVPFGEMLLEPTRNGLTKPKAIRGQGVKMIAMGEIFAHSRIGAIEMERVPVTDKERDNCAIQEGDLLFARQSLVLDGAGKCSIVTKVTEDTVFESHLIRTRIDPHKANPYFLYYYFNSYIGRENIKTIVEQVAAAGIRGSDLVKLDVPCPSLEDQNRLVALLDRIDRKIELNSEISDNLAEMLQSIYQQQFGTPTQGEILSDICEYSKDRITVSSLTLSSYYSTENMLPSKAGAVEASGLPSIAQTTKAKAGDVLISNIRPYFKKIVYCHTECGCSTDVLCFTPKISAMSAFLYGTLYADRFFDFMVAGSKGTKMPRGDKQQIMTFPIHRPSAEELLEFNGIALPILSQIEEHRIENTRLAALRDTLLPRLMSGEIDVGSIEV